MQIRLEFKLADCWIGVFWRRERPGRDLVYHWDVWICLIPCLPLHLSWWRK